MQSLLDIVSMVFPILYLVMLPLCGGLVTKYIIRKLEIEEREREGDFHALIYLRAAEKHVIRGEKSGISAMIGKTWTVRQDNIVIGLIQSAARSQKKYRERLYLTSITISKTNLHDPVIHMPSAEIRSFIEEMESDYFDFPLDVKNQYDDDSQ